MFLDQLVQRAISESQEKRVRMAPLAQLGHRETLDLAAFLESVGPKERKAPRVKGVWMANQGHRALLDHWDHQDHLDFRVLQVLRETKACRVKKEALVFKVQLA